MAASSWVRVAIATCTLHCKGQPKSYRAVSTAEHLLSLGSSLSSVSATHRAIDFLISPTSVWNSRAYIGITLMRVRPHHRTAGLFDAHSISLLHHNPLRHSSLVCFSDIQMLASPLLHVLFFSWVIFLAPNIGKSLLPQCSPHKVITCARSPRAGVHSVFPGFRHVKIWLQTRTHPCLCSAMHINLIVRKTAKATRSNQLQITHFIKYTDMKKKTSKKSEAPLKEVVEQAVEQIT